MTWIFFMVFAYLLGSIPTGLVVARVLGHDDPRSAGSGNIGATNVGRTMGKKAGVVTLVGDALKGLIPTVWALGTFHSPWASATVATAAYLGHLYPVYLRFRGGKGVATGLGVFLALAPGSVFWAAVVFSIVVWKWRVVSLGSLSSAAALPLLTAFFREPLAVVALAVVVAVFTAWKHEENFGRILAGTESRLGGDS
jgi:glycerol-3-phosphate acyltransferase PlsY